MPFSSALEAYTASTTALHSAVASGAYTTLLQVEVEVESREHALSFVVVIRITLTLFILSYYSFHYIYNIVSTSHQLILYQLVILPLIHRYRLRPPSLPASLTH